MEFKHGDVDEGDVPPDLLLVSASDPQPPDVRTIPVTILTGFLGSGKTTLLTHILKANHGKRIAVIENEFGEGLGIETMIAKSGVDGKSLEGFFELGNGCICCTVKDELASTLEQLALHKDRFDYLIIETTGVANPGPVIETFWLDDELESCLKLDGVVTVVDSANFLRDLESPDTCEETRHQIGYADRILLNKCDLVAAEQLTAVEHLVRSLNGAAEIQHTTFSDVSVQWVLDINCFSFDTFTPTQTHTHTHTHDTHCEHEHGCDACHAEQATTTHRAANLSTHGIVFGGLVDILQVERFLGSLIWEPPHEEMQIYRMKGMLRPANGCNLYILQAVHQLLDVQESTYALRDADENKIVIIGRNLHAGLIEDGLKACVMSM